MVLTSIIRKVIELSGKSPGQNKLPLDYFQRKKFSLSESFHLQKTASKMMKNKKSYSVFLFVHFNSDNGLLMVLTSINHSSIK